MHVIVDTNVPIVANGATEQASEKCMLDCIAVIKSVSTQHILVIDDDWKVLGEYTHKLRSSGQLGVGDAFLKWVLTNRANRKRCEQISLTPKPTPF